ncbi:MAG: YCF48-related protein [Candidatus Izemoplasmatales bacterium]
MSGSFKYKSGRIWLQRKKFEPYQLLLPYGITGITDPVGNLTAIREPSASKRGESVIVDITKGEPALPQFQIDTRLQNTFNYMLGLKDCTSNFQCHLGKCGRADDYYGSSSMLLWERSHRGDLSIDRMAMIEGDDAPVQTTVPFVAEVGPIPVDFGVEFTSPRTILETEAVSAMAFLESECLEDCRSQADAGENGYLATLKLVGSALNTANVWYTGDKGETWLQTSSNPLPAGVDISDILAIGTKKAHRLIVSGGTTRAGEHAIVAYADVTVMGTTTWVQVEVGTTDDEYINKLYCMDWTHVYAVTDLGNIYMSGDGGVTWESVYAGAADLYDITGYRDGTLWAVGESNLVLYSSDYGASWTVVTGPVAGSGDDNMSVCLTPDGTVLIGNNAGELYGSYDNGDEWTTLAVQGIAVTSIDRIASWGDSIIWVIATTASGSRVFRSVDGGASFRLWALGLPTNSGLNALAVVDPNVVFVGGEPHGGTAFISKTISNFVGI